MAENSKIAWTNHTFNTHWGCVKVSPGCANCYAATFSKRTGHDIWGLDKPRRFFGPKHWQEPLKWNRDACEAKEQRLVFCNSMSDLFETHPTQNDLLDEVRYQLAGLVRSTPWLTWLLLTKRIEQAGGYLQTMFETLPDNVWIGTTAENQAMHNKRIGPLMAIPARVRFLSVEPQLELVTLSEMQGYTPDWVISGGESGAGCRPFNPDWARSLRDQCQKSGAAFFFKQMGGVTNHHSELSDFPEDLRVREFPTARL